jgi:maltooligosyltrehalose synthase
VIAVAGRFFAKPGFAERDPEDSSVWEGGELALPKGLAGGIYRDVLTKRTLRPQERQGRSVLSLKEVFACFPAALLERL